MTEKEATNKVELEKQTQKPSNPIGTLPIKRNASKFGSLNEKWLVKDQEYEEIIRKSEEKLHQDKQKKLQNQYNDSIKQIELLKKIISTKDMTILEKEKMLTKEKLKTKKLEKEMKKLQFQHKQEIDD